jgi:hypothetical protein
VGFTESPHRKFFGPSKIFANITFGVSTKRPKRKGDQLSDLDGDGVLGGKKEEREMGEREREERDKGGDRLKKEDLLCYLSLTEALGVKTSAGNIPSCTNSECRFVYKKTASEITHRQAKVASKARIPDVSLRTNLKAKVQESKPEIWKAAKEQPSKKQKTVQFK